MLGNDKYSRGTKIFYTVARGLIDEATSDSLK